jgi:hypothetical protein
MDVASSQLQEPPQHYPLHEVRDTDKTGPSTQQLIEEHVNNYLF